MGEQEDIDGAQSVIEYFRTLEFTPSPPADIAVKNINPHEVIINWKEPNSLNGIIDHYEVIMELRRIDETRIMQRPFCDDEYKIVEYEDTEVSTHIDEGEENNNQNIDENGVCSCKNCIGGDQTANPETDNASNQKAKHNEENEFENDLSDSVWPDIIWTPPPPDNVNELSDVISEAQRDRHKREIDSGSGNKLGIQVNNLTTPAVSTKTKEDILKDTLEVLKPGTREVHTRIFKIISSNVTTLKVKKLRHFGQYSLKIRACHKVVPSNLEKYPECSEYAKEEIQTEPDKTADNIGRIWVVRDDQEEKAPRTSRNDSHIDTTDKPLENKGEEVFISWDPPKDPNLLIVNYQLKFIFDSNKEHQDKTDGCETAKQFNATNNR